MSTARKKILFVTERFAPDIGGVAVSANRIANRIDELGAELHVLAWTKQIDAGRLESRPFGRQSTIHRLGTYSNMDFTMQHTNNVLHWLNDSQGFDAVWGHYVYPAGFVGVMFAEEINCPSIVSARGNDIDRLMFPPGDFARLQWTLDRASYITTVSNELARKIRLITGNRDDIDVIYNVVDSDTFVPRKDSTGCRELAGKYGISQNTLVLGFCGELRHKKGLPFLLSALNTLRRTRPVKLLVIGEVRPKEQATLSAFFADHPACEQCVVVTGKLETSEEVVACMHLCDVYLQPSVWEGLPNALLEAMACGVICVASDAGGITDVIEHEENGFVIPIHQLNRLAEAVHDVVNLPNETKDLILSNARDTIQRRFSPQNELNTLERILNKCWDQSS